MFVLSTHYKYCTAVVIMDYAVIFCNNNRSCSVCLLYILWWVVSGGNVLKLRYTVLF